jgi:predicted Ser/Thr protein kinase
MPAVLTCPQGHRWELPGNGQADTTEWPVHCPVCGAAVEAAALTAAEGSRDAAAAETPSETPTLAPAGPVAVAEGLPSIDGYEVLAELGRGGMGVVYRAHHVRLDRPVAVKLLPAESGRDAAFAERFTREARALARLNHPSIITIYDFGQAGGQSYFVMEYVEGTNLRQRMRAGRLSPEEALRIALQVCDALQYAHELGIVHRDVKPENVLLDRLGRVKIADFGLVKLLNRKSTQYTLTGPWQAMGTLHYMAPEQTENRPALDHRADIYSLGVMLYEMLTGELPLGRFAPPSQRSPVDPRLDEIVLRALEREPEHRYQNVGELKAALEELVGASPRPALVGATATQAGAARAPGLLAEDKTSPDVGAGPAGGLDEDARWRVKRAAVGLIVTGIIHVLPVVAAVIVLLSLSHSVVIKEPGIFVPMIYYGAVVPVLGGIILWGALRMLQVRSYRAAVCSAVVAMLPFSPFWVVSMWLGLWAAIVLNRREVRAAFRATALRSRRTYRLPEPVHRFLGRTTAPVRRFLGTATMWAMLTSIAGVIVCVQPLSPWAALEAMDSQFQSHTLAAAYGYQSWVGIVPAGIFLAVLLVLIATGVLEPVPLWRPIVLMLAGATALPLSVTWVVRPGSIWAGDTGEFRAVLNPQGQPDFFGDGAFQLELLGTMRPSPVRFSVTSQFADRDARGARATFTVGGQPATIYLPAEAGMSLNNFLGRLKVTAGLPAYAASLLGLALLLLGTLQLRGVLSWRNRPVAS